MASYSSELDFEKDVMALLPSKGWEPQILKYKTEQELIDNWANILYQNNKGIDKLNGQSLTDSEMAQILEQLKTNPYKLHSFINGKTIKITRDNPNDPSHLGKDVYLKIYDRNEIAGGQSVYQIVEQPKFSKHHPLAQERRGDFTLLINGMPVIHVELKKSKDYLSEGINQIIKYSHENVFTGIFALVQIFVVMTPDETVYFANPGQSGQFLKEFMFHWADFNNEPVTDWHDICDQLLSIPMAHEMIGFYSVADATDETLKVLRSYQYNAVKQISKKVGETDWELHSEKGGYIWHTTGSGKTLTSFKAAQLIASSKDADKVLFLMDRIELGTQSLDDYKNFADDNESVVGTESSNILLGKLKSNSPDDTLIVTSIQKLAILSKEGKIGDSDLDIIKKKKKVIIVDECHRSTFGDMMIDIKNVFKDALFFGFSGTPIQDENSRGEVTTASIFGDELHRYTIADGIRDNNVLGFDPRPVATFEPNELRKVVALNESCSNTVAEALGDPNKKDIYLKFMDRTQIKDAGDYDSSGEYVLGIEDYVPDAQYSEPTQKHKKKVVEDILSNWDTLSLGGKFHAILATNSIPEAIEYYQLFKTYRNDERFPKLNITAIFDPTIDNKGGAPWKEDSLIEILNDYNNTYGQVFTIPTAGAFKRDACLRLAHKEPYVGIDEDRSKVINLVIVVDQLLTGFDSKWINTLYLDKMLKNEHIIQAMSRTNRLFNKQEKPHGIVKFYRRPFTMIVRMERALNIYSGNKPYGVFVDKLDKNLKQINAVFVVIKDIFVSAGIPDFSKLPSDNAAKAKFSKEFNKLNKLIVSAKLQGMTWDKSVYDFPNEQIKLDITENDYISLLQRYKELTRTKNTTGASDVPLDIDPSITNISTDLIDANYMQSKFKKYLVALNSGNAQDRQDALDELHKTFSTLSQEEQKQANIILTDIYSGKLVPDGTETIKDYIIEYMLRTKQANDIKLANILGIPYDVLKKFLDEVNKKNPDEFGRLKALKELINKQNLKATFEKQYNKKLTIPKINIELDTMLRDYLEQDGFDVDEYEAKQ